MKFPERLKAIRDSRGITQRHLSEVLNITISTISHYENGTREPSIEILIQMAEVLNVSVDYLVGNTDVNILPEEMNKPFAGKSVPVKYFNEPFSLILATEWSWNIC